MAPDWFTAKAERALATIDPVTALWLELGEYVQVPPAEIEVYVRGQSIPLSEFSGTSPKVNPLEVAS